MEAVGVKYHYEAAEATDADVKRARLKLGQCPTCGVRCYKPGWFGKMRTITRPPYVFNGRCLKCHPTAKKQNETSETEASDDVGIEDMIRLLAAAAGLTEDKDDEEQRFSDVQPWNGTIQPGSHVRCIGTSYGGAGVEVGDIGIASSRDESGEYRIDFPTKDGWHAKARDIVVDEEAEKIHRGALVRVKSGIEPKFGWGNLVHSKDAVGYVKKVRYDGIAEIQFGWFADAKPSEYLYKARLQELQVVSPEVRKGHWPGAFQCGDAVRLRDGIKEPSTGMGNLKPGETGYVRAMKTIAGRIAYACDFPSTDGWFGYEEDLEIDPMGTLIRPGRKVRVKHGIEPKKKWGGVSPSSVGTVVSISYDGDPVVVKFPENPRWKCLLNELEVLGKDGSTGHLPQAVPVSQDSVPMAKAQPVPHVGDTAVLANLTGMRHLNGSEVTIVEKCSDDRFRVRLTVNGDRVYTVGLNNLVFRSGEFDIKVGDVAILRNLKGSSSLNGSEVVVIEASDDGRFRVKLENGKVYSVKPSNLEPVVLD